MSKLLKTFLYVFVVSLVGCFIPSPLLLAEGFVAGTVVATPTGKVPIDHLNVGDLVVSYNFETAALEPARIVGVSKKKIASVTQLTVDNEVVEVDADHKFYCPLLKEQWIEARYLQKHHFLLKGLAGVVRINAIAPLQKEAEACSLALEHNHNFFVSEQEILVHNFAIPLLAPFIAWVAQNFVFTVGVSIFGVGAGVVMSQGDNKNQQKPQCDMYVKYENTSFSPGPEEPEDPKKDKDQDKKESMYKDVTEPRSRKPNTETDLTRQQFEENLQKDGWTKTVSTDGKAHIYEKNGARYSVRNDAKSTEGPTADYYKPGSDPITGKIRLLKD